MRNKIAKAGSSTMIEVDSASSENDDCAEARAEDQAATGTQDLACSGTDDSTASRTEDPPTDGDRVDAPIGAEGARRRWSISIGVRSLVVAVIIAMLMGAVGTFAWLYLGAEHKLDAQASVSANNARAEKIALDYAVNAAAMDFKDLKAWKVKLVMGTSQMLNDKLTNAAESMEQILVPLQWTSTAKPLVAKVRSSAGGVYVVDCFVSVQTKTVQAPDPLLSTATYSVTIDSNQNWVITDVGGIGSVVDRK